LTRVSQHESHAYETANFLFGLKQIKIKVVRKRETLDTSTLIVHGDEGKEMPQGMLEKFIRPR